MTIIRFDCNCTNETEFREMVNGIHEAKCGTNFEVGARLWHTLDGINKAIMVEYQITTKECKELIENDNEPDWLVAYEVNDENDDDCSKEIFELMIDDNIRFDSLENSMVSFARFVCEKFYS